MNLLQNHFTLDLLKWFFNPSLSIFYEGDIKDRSLTKVQQFSKFSLGEIGSQH